MAPNLHPHDVQRSSAADQTVTEKEQKEVIHSYIAQLLGTRPYALITI